MFLLNEKIEVCNFSVYLPLKSDGTRATKGTVVELLNRGNFSVKFEGYANTIDYTSQEARCFRVVQS